MLKVNALRTMATDAALPRIDPTTAGLFYDLMMKVDAIFRKNHLFYWATCGTLLGAVRHQGIIPWDDDLDIAIFAEDIPKLESLVNDLAQVGLDLYYFSSLNFFDRLCSSGRSQ